MRKITKITSPEHSMIKNLLGVLKNLLTGYCSKQGSRIAYLLILHPTKELILFPFPDEETKAWGCKEIYHMASTRQARDWNPGCQIAEFMVLPTLFY